MHPEKVIRSTKPNMTRLAREFFEEMSTPLKFSKSNKRILNYSIQKTFQLFQERYAEEIAEQGFLGRLSIGSTTNLATCHTKRPHSIRVGHMSLLKASWRKQSQHSKDITAKKPAQATVVKSAESLLPFRQQCTIS